MKQTLYNAVGNISHYRCHSVQLGRSVIIFLICKVSFYSRGCFIFLLNYVRKSTKDSLSKCIVILAVDVNLLLKIHYSNLALRKYFNIDYSKPFF